MKIMLFLTAVARECLSDVLVKLWPAGLSHRVPLVSQVPDHLLTSATQKLLA